MWEVIRGVLIKSNGGNINPALSLTNINTKDAQEFGANNWWGKHDSSLQQSIVQN